MHDQEIVYVLLSIMIQEVDSACRSKSDFMNWNVGVCRFHIMLHEQQFQWNTAPLML